MCTSPSQTEARAMRIATTPGHEAELHVADCVCAYYSNRNSGCNHTFCSRTEFSTVERDTARSETLPNGSCANDHVRRMSEAVECRNVRHDVERIPMRFSMAAVWRRACGRCARFHLSKDSFRQTHENTHRTDRNASASILNDDDRPSSANKRS